MAQKQSCAVCRGDRPLYEKKPSPPYHFKIWIRDGVLSVDGTLVNLIHRKKELVPISLFLQRQSASAGGSGVH